MKNTVSRILKKKKEAANKMFQFSKISTSDKFYIHENHDIRAYFSEKKKNILKEDSFHIFMHTDRVCVSHGVIIDVTIIVHACR